MNICCAGMTRDRRLQRSIERENDLHQDLVQGNFRDTYRQKGPQRSEMTTCCWCQVFSQSHSSSRGRCVPRAVSLSNMCWVSDFLLWLQEPLLQEHHGPTVGFWVLWAGTGQGRSVLTLSVLSRLSSSWRLTTTSMLTCTRLWCWPDDTPALCSTWATGSSSVQYKEVSRSRWDLTDNISSRLDYSRSEIYQIWDPFCVWKPPYFIKTQGKARNASIRGALSSIFMA